MALRSSSSRPAAGGSPGFALLDARERGLDAEGLRAWARQVAAAAPGPSSRSYRAPFALVAWSEGAVGVDLERIETPPPGFAVSISTPEERRSLGGRLEDAEVVADLWAGKEALAKALGDALRYDPRRLDAPLLWPDGRCGSWRAERLDVAPVGHVAWVCWRGGAQEP